MLEKRSKEDALYHAIWPKGAPKQNIECSKCGQLNRLDTGKATLFMDKCRCGSCGTLMFISSKDPMVALKGEDYQHPLDRSSLGALRSIPGLPLVLKKFMSEIGEKPLRYQLLASSVQCGQEQFPLLYEQLGQTCTRLGISTIPTLFLSQSPVVNASTFGAEDPVIVVHSGLVYQLDAQGVQAVLGHELGHVQCEHATYKLLATLILQGGSRLGGWSQILTAPLRLALQKWSRCAELSADRAGLLASRSLGASIQVLLRLAGGVGEWGGMTQLQVGPFVAQARALKTAENENWMDGLFANLLTMNRSHPYIAWRLLKILEWVESGAFLRLLSSKSEA